MLVPLTMAETIVAAAGLGQVDKCRMTIASLAASTASGAFVCLGSLGIGCAAGVIAMAAEAFNVYGQCTGG